MTCEDVYDDVGTEERPRHFCQSDYLAALYGVDAQTAEGWRSQAAAAIIDARIDGAAKGDLALDPFHRRTSWTA